MSLDLNEAISMAKNLELAQKNSEIYQKDAFPILEHIASAISVATAEPAPV